MLVLVVFNYYFIYSLFVYVAAAPNSESAEEKESTSKGVNEIVDDGEETSDAPPKDNDNTVPVETTQPNESDKKKQDFKTIIFELTQEASNQYMSNDAFKTLETIKGLEFSTENVTKFRIWPQGIIPYFIDNLSFDKVLSDKIREYLDITNSLTGLRFRELPRPPADDASRWVFFLNRNGWSQCWDYADTDFTATGVQRAVIGYDCLDDGGQMADLVIGLLGIPQQHNAPDRDTFVQYNEKSVIEEKARFYIKVNAEDWLFKDIEYDFLSVSHLPFYKNSIDGNAVIKPLKPVSGPVGETKGFSFSDLHKIRLMYNSITSKSDEKIKLSNCQKLYRPGNKDVVNEDSPSTDKALSTDKATSTDKAPSTNVANLFVFGNKSQQSNDASPKLEGDVDDRVKKMSQNSIALKFERKLRKPKKFANARLSTEDPLKWEDVNSDDK